jgi:uncharacterized protein YajQ (UPF0234 family)
MPSFDFSSEADIAALHNAVDLTKRTIDNRYDFKATRAKVELNEKDKLIKDLTVMAVEMPQMMKVMTAPLPWGFRLARRNRSSGMEHAP